MWSFSVVIISMSFLDFILLQSMVVKLVGELVESDEFTILWPSIRSTSMQTSFLVGSGKLTQTSPDSLQLVIAGMGYNSWNQNLTQNDAHVGHSEVQLTLITLGHRQRQISQHPIPNFNHCWWHPSCAFHLRSISCNSVIHVEGSLCYSVFHLCSVEGFKLLLHTSLSPCCISLCPTIAEQQVGAASWYDSKQHAWPPMPSLHSLPSVLVCFFNL